MRNVCLLFFVLMVMVIPTDIFSQTYQLVWEENFDGSTLNSDVWNVENQVGIWNTGSNQELQHYRTDNVSVGPDDEGGNALIITAKRENYNGYQFTSGRINTSAKVSARYGKIEARIKLPTLANGLWPAFWMLGTRNIWPASGEIDIMEAGNSQGIQNNQQDRTFNGALHWQYEGNYAGYGPQVIAPVGTSLYNYNRVTLVWTPSRIEMFLNDASNPYFAMDITGTDAEEFRDWPHYFILNLAVGGAFPGITNPVNITSPLPANMYVDYIRVYQREGEGELVVTSPVAPPSSDYYGIYTERTFITNKFIIDDVTSHLYLWNNLTAMEGQTPYEGSDMMAFQSPGDGWCGFGIFSDNSLDLSHFATGYLNFAVKIPTGSTQSFTVLMEGAESTKGNIVFAPGSDPLGVERDGNWCLISIPVTQLTAQGLNLSACGNIFAVVSDNPTSGFFFDDVYLSINKPTSIFKPGSDIGDIIVFPNPANNQFGVELNELTESIEVVDLIGGMIFQKSQLAGSGLLHINCSGWSKGIYVVSTLSVKGDRKVAKIRIQ